MTLDKEVDKVLQRTDTILTKAGYGIVDDVDASNDPYATYDEVEVPMPQNSSVEFVDSFSVVEDEDSDVHFDSGIPAGLKEAPQS